MRLLTLFCFIFLFSNVANACSAAYQYSLFPLGASMGKVVVLEAELNRYLKTPQGQLMEIGGRFNNDPFSSSDIEVRWKGSLKIYYLQAGEWTLIKDLGFVDILDKRYQEALQPYFSEAMEVAHALPMFEEARVEQRGVCHFDRNCRFVEKVIDTTQIALYLRSTEKGFSADSCRAVFPPKILEKMENKTAIKFTQWDSLETQIRIDFFRVWRPQGVRRYTIGTRTVQVFSMGKGDRSKYVKTQEKEWQVPYTANVEAFVVGNDVMFHGQRFDFLHILDD